MTAERFGLSISDSDIARLTGRRAHEVFADLASGIGGTDEAEFLAAVSTTTAALFDEHLVAFEDGEDTVEHLHRIGFRLGVASSSDTGRLGLSLRLTGLTEYFEVVVSGDHVDSGKPSPDIYLAAAADLGVDPRDCVAVEDSPPGIASARSAGMRVVAVDRGQFGLDALGLADVVVPKLTPAVFLG